MADHRYYLSIMTPAASTGDIQLQIDTYDADFNISIQPDCTGFTAGMSETDTAIVLQNQLVLQTPQYSGAPRFSAEPYAATFRITRTEHVICIWSQAQFRVQILNNNVGCNVKESTAPCLMTLAVAEGRAAAYGIPFATPNGGQLTTQEIIDLIEVTSSELCGYLRNNVVISTYLGEWRTDGMKAVFTSPCPGLAIDQPLIRRKNLYEMYSIPQYSQLAYNWVRHTGQLVFRFNQTYINAGEPFELDNEVRVTFIAGNWVIPADVQRGLYLLMILALTQGPGAVEELGGGTFKVKFKKTTEQLDRILRPLKSYAQKKMR